MGTIIKAAIATDDGNTISAHLGRAKYFEVFTVIDGIITERKRREKEIHPVSSSFTGHSGLGRSWGRTDSTNGRKHKQIIGAISDCTHVIARGMGSDAYSGLALYNIKPILSDIRTIDEAIKALVSGTIVNHKERIH